MADEAELSKSFLWSVKNGDMSEVKTLMAKEKSLGTKEISGRSPLHFAADYGQTAVVEYLVANGAGINIEDQYGITPLLSAIFEGHKETVALLLKKKSLGTKEISGRSPLHFAADYGQTAVVEYLVANGAGINIEDQYGITPLLSAIFEGHKETVALLLKKGANKNGKSPDGRPYLDCAETDEMKSLLSKA